MEYNANDTLTSPDPPPPPPPIQQSISISQILDDYYDGESFGSESMSAMNAADLVLAEIDNISPSRQQLKGDNTTALHCEGSWNSVSRHHGENAPNTNASDPTTTKLRDNAVHQEKECSPLNHVEFINTKGRKDIGAYSNTDELQSSQEKSSESSSCSNKLPLHQVCKSSSLDRVEQKLEECPIGECAVGNEYEPRRNGVLNGFDHDEMDARAAIKSPPALRGSRETGKSPNNATIPSDVAVKQKRPFLRKGTRREPSSLHRIKVTPTPKICTTKETPISSERENSIKLEHLERMQEQQRKNLQTRIERRQRAREDIRKKKKGCKIQVVHEDDINMRNEEQDENVSACVSSEEMSDSSRESETDESGSDSDESQKSEVVKKTNFARRKSTLKSSDKRKSSYNAKQRKEFQDPEMEEQWQLIKSMRRRQEAALRAAEKEREEARLWAASEREKLQKWQANQRLLIQKEKQRATNNAMVSQRKKRREKLQEQAAEATMFSRKQAKEEIENLKETLRKQKIETDATKSRHRLSEKRWKDMISDRDNQIEHLKEDLNCLQEKNKRLEEDKDNLKKQLESELAEKRKNKRKQKMLKKQKSSKRSSLEEDVCNSTTLNLQTLKAKEPSQSGGGGNIKENNLSSRCSTKSTVDEIESTLISSGASNIQSDQLESAFEQTQQEVHVSEIVSSNQELIQDPKEDWLFGHLDDAGRNSSLIQNNEAGNVPFYTPLKEKPYNPSDYVVELQQSVTQNRSKFNNIPHSIAQDFTHGIVGDKRGNARDIVTFQNGTTKEILPDGTQIVRFANGDVKTSYGNIGVTVYYYEEAKTSHTTHPDGTEVFEFSSGQTEHHFPDGRKEVTFPDGTSQVFFSKGGSETIFSDGVEVMETGGHQQIINF